jgi:hypothetical protein
MVGKKYSSEFEAEHQADKLFKKLALVIVSPPTLRCSGLQAYLLVFGTS